MYPEDLPFESVRIVRARCETELGAYPHDRVDYREGAPGIARGEPVIESVARKK